MTSRFPLRNCPSAIEQESKLRIVYRSAAGDSVCFLKASPALVWTPQLGQHHPHSLEKHASSSLPLENNLKMTFFGGSHLLPVQLFKWEKSCCVCQHRKHCQQSKGRGSVDPGNMSCVCILAVHPGSWKSILTPALPEQELTSIRSQQSVTGKSCMSPRFRHTSNRKFHPQIPGGVRGWGCSPH